MKRCPKCGNKGEFYKNRSRPDGLSYWCKDCMKEACNDGNCKRMRVRRKTPQGKAVCAWNGIRQRAGNSDGKHPAYKKVKILMTRAEFLEWAIPAYTVWMKNNPGVTPSVDRIILTGHYEIDNLQIVSLGENSRKTQQHKNVTAPEGQAWCSQCQKYYPKENFYRNRYSHHGLQYLCKMCSSKTNIESRRKKKEG